MFLDMLQWLPERASTFAKEIDTIFYVIYWITGFFFLFVTVLLVWFLIQYRARPGRRGRAIFGLIRTQNTNGAAGLIFCEILSRSAVYNGLQENPSRSGEA